MLVRCLNMLGLMGSLFMLGACGSHAGSRLKDSIDKKNGINITLLKIKNKTAQGTPIHPNLPLEYPILRISYSTVGPDGQAVTEKFGMRIDCGADTANAFRAFGYDNANQEFFESLTQGSAAFNNLGVDRQSVIRCENGVARADNRIFVIPSDHGAKLSRYFLKFGNYRNPEQTQLYELKCTKNFDFIGGDFKKAIPISEASLKYLYGHAGLDERAAIKIPPLTCSPGSDPGIYDLPQYPAPPKIVPPIISNQNPVVYRVNNEELDERMGSVGQYLLVVSNGKGFPIKCGPDWEPLTTAMGLKVDPSSPLLPESSDLVQRTEPRSQPVLTCPTDENKLDRLIRISDYTADTYYIRFKNDPNSLLRLGCQGLTDFFQDPTVPLIEIPKAALPYLAENPDQTRLFDVACKNNQQLVQSIERIYQEVLNLRPSPDAVASILAAVERLSAAPDAALITDYIIRSVFKDATDLDRVIGDAFWSAWGRHPEGEENDFIKAWITQDKIVNGMKLRRHYLELLNHLQRLQNLSRADYIQSFRDALGCDPTGDDNAYWYPRLLSEPRVLPSYDAAVTGIVNWSRSTNFEKLLPLVVRAAYNWDMNGKDREQLVHIIHSGVRPHYKELLAYLQNNPLIPLDRFVSITSVHSNKIIEVPSGGLAGTLISQYDNLHGSHMRWKITEAGPGVYQLHPQHSPGDCMTVWMTNGTVTDNHDVRLGYCSDETRKYWKFVRRGNHFGIQTALADKCLDVYSASKDNGARIAVWGCHYQNHQLWDLR